MDDPIVQIFNGTPTPTPPPVPVGLLLGTAQVFLEFADTATIPPAFGLSLAYTGIPTILNPQGDPDIHAQHGQLKVSVSGEPALYVATGAFFVNVLDPAAGEVYFMTAEPSAIWPPQGIQSTWVIPGAYPPGPSIIGAEGTGQTITQGNDTWTFEIGILATATTDRHIESSEGTGQPISGSYYIARYGLPT